MKNRFIPFSQPSIEEDEIRVVMDVLKSGWLTTGEKCEELEKKIEQYLSIKNAISTNSCTAGLHLALYSLGIQKCDEVITTPFTFVSTVNAIKYCGANPVLVDIEDEYYNLNTNLIEKVITDKTKAIIAVHYGGNPCDLDKLVDISKKYNLFLIEDAAHAMGSEYNNTKVGTFGDMGVFSFYVTKPMTTGEGGIVVTNNDRLEKKIKSLRLHGISQDAWKRYGKEGQWYYEMTDLGFKYNLSDINAALGVEQIKKLDQFNERRRDIAKLYTALLQDCSELILPKEPEYGKSAWHLYPIRIKQNKINISRNEIIELLKEKNIGTSVHFIPIHYHEYYKKTLSNKKGDFPVTENVFASIISLPIFPKMSEEDVRYVSTNLKDLILKHKK